MKVKVAQDGVTIPKSMLHDAEEVEIRQEDDVVVVTPVPHPGSFASWGENPVTLDVSDGSIHHDQYLYDEPNLS